MAALLALAPALTLAADPHPALALIERGAVAMRSDPEASRRNAEAALGLLAAAPQVDLEIRARLVLCDYYSERDRAAAEKHVAAATALLPRAQRGGLRAGVLTCQAEVLESAGSNAQAKTLYDQAVDVAADAHDEEMLAGALFSRGYLLGLRGDYAAGLADLQQAHGLYESLRMPHHALTALNGVAILYNRMGDYAQAKRIYTTALQQQLKEGMRREVAVTQHNLGRAHENLHEWEEARQAFTESMQASREIAYPRGEAYALRGLAAVATARGEPRRALELLERAATLQRRTTDERLRAHIQLARGMALRRLGRLGESATALEDALQVFREGNVLGELSATAAELAAVNAQLGNWRAAYERQTAARAASEQLLRNQLDQRFATLKVEFDTAAKEQENALLLRENAASEAALLQGRRVRQLQAAVIVLTALLACALAWLAIHQRRSSVRMRALAMTDELTSAPNRRAVLGRLELILARPQPQPCAILILDIDHFKSINDHHGHPAGDEVLRLVAQRLRAAVREPAFFGRLGGEEFLIVLPETRLEDACALAERLREQLMGLDTSRWFADRRRITASVGVTGSQPGDTPSSMLQRADAALYAAKRAGRNCVRVDAAAAPAPLSWASHPLPG